MDEPTNDLDVETLELLEELLLDYHGTILLVSHDRAFLDNVVTSVLVFEGNGQIGEYVGGYTDWVRYSKQKLAEQPHDPAHPASARQAEKIEPPTRIKTVDSAEKHGTKNKKLTFKEQRELSELPIQIESLEAELSPAACNLLGDAAFSSAAGQLNSLQNISSRGSVDQRA
jgi:ATP-binding cassette subfamily F protein uup